jgi:hypothetical protein
MPIVKGNQVKSTTLANLGSAQSAGVNSAALVDGLFNIKSNGKHWELQNAGIKSQRKQVAAERIYGTVGKDSVAGRTAHLVIPAPAHFDAVRITYLSSVSEGNAHKITVAPSAKYNTLGPVDSNNTAITPTVVTFGSTDNASPRNPNGGVVTVTSTGASGSSNTIIQDRIRSDIIQLLSLDRTDVVGKRPLLYIRVYGTNIPLSGIAEMADNSANTLKTVPWFGGEYYSGYATGDYSLTNPTSWAQYGAPMVEVEFFLRGKQVRNIGITGDSTDQGWTAATAVPQFGGNINGYLRRFVKMLRDEGEPVGYSCFAQAGQHSFMTYNNALPAVLSGELTHLVIRPFSVNDRADGTTAAICNAALQRTTLLIQACKAKGVVPILLRPFAFGVNESIQQPLVTAYCDSYKSSGGLVLDFTSLVNAANYTLQTKYLSVDSGGAVVDQIHLNDLAHQDIANFIYTKCDWMFS